MLLSFRHGVSPGAKKQGEVMWPSPPPSFFSPPLLLLKPQPVGHSVLLDLLFIFWHMCPAVSSDLQQWVEKLVSSPEMTLRVLIADGTQISSKLFSTTPVFTHTHPARGSTAFDKLRSRASRGELAEVQDVLFTDQGRSEQAQQAKVEVKAEGEVVIGRT